MARFPSTPMPPSEIPENLLRKLNPGYWGGEVLGDDSGQAPEPPGSTRARKRAAQCIARAIELTAQSSSLESWQTGERFEAGSTFVSDEQEPGTVVLLRKEELTRTGSTIPYADMRQLKQLDPPAPPTDLDIDFSVQALERSAADRIAGAGVAYTSAVHLGLVTVDHEHQKRLFTIPHGRVNRTLDGRRLDVGVIWGSDLEPNPLNVGEVQHYSGREWDAERLVRVNVIVAHTLPELMEHAQ